MTRRASTSPRTPGAAFRRQGTPFACVLALALAVGVVGALAHALPLTWGTLPWGVDHGAFLYRVLEYRHAFPALGSYNPHWNAGTEHFIGVTSGAHGFALLNAPLFFAFRDPARWYGPALAFWLFAGFPVLAALSLRRCGARAVSCLSAALLMLAFTRAQFHFFWQSGNLGGMVAAGLAFPVAALSWKIAGLGRGTAADASALALAAFLSCLWTPGLATCAAVALGALALPRRFSRRSFPLLLIAAGAALALLSPWFATTIFQARGIVRYVGGAAPDAGGASVFRMLCIGLDAALARAAQWHPATLAFGFAALFLPLPRTAPLVTPRLRRFFLPGAVLLLAATASIGFNRSSQLDRISIQTAAFLAVPAAIALGRLFAAHPGGSPARRAALRLAQTGAVALLATWSPRLAILNAANADGEKLWVAEPVVFEFANWVAQNVPPGARLAFSGETDCKLDWGKGTYLPILAGREMMSDDYYGFPRGLTERNYPPRHYRRSTEAFLFFSRVYGITHWAVTDSRTRRFCEEESSHFRLVARFQMQSTDVRVYEITDPDARDPTAFFLGRGTATARENRIVVQPADPNDPNPLVLRYNWRDGIKCLTPGATIEPWDVDENIRFIAVHPNGAASVEIGYKPRFRPIAPNFDGTFHH